MPRIVKMGQVACGSIAQRGTLNHLSKPDIKDKVELVAVMDVVTERAKGCMERFGAKEWYDDYDEMLEKSDLDAVTIASPIGLHFEQAMKAVEAGVHVHLNKTMTTTLEEANRLIEVAEKKGVKIVASPGERAILPTTCRVRELIRDGAAGKVYWARMHSSYPGHEFETFRGPDDEVVSVDPTWYYKKGGGPVADVGAYALHTITSILGSVKRVAAMSGVKLAGRGFKGKKISVEVDDNTAILMDWGDSTYGFLTSTFTLPGPGGAGGLFIWGGEGSIMTTDRGVEIWSRRIPAFHAEERLPQLRGIYTGQRAVRTFYEELAEPEFQLPYLSGIHHYMPETHVFNDVMHLVNCIINEREPTVWDKVKSAHHARHVIEVMEKGYESARTGRTLKMTTTF